MGTHVRSSMYSIADQKEVWIYSVFLKKGINVGPAGQCLNISGEYNILNSYLPSDFKEKSYLPCSQFTKFIPVKER